MHDMWAGGVGNTEAEATMKLSDLYVARDVLIAAGWREGHGCAQQQHLLACISGDIAGLSAGIAGYGSTPHKKHTLMLYSMLNNTRCRTYGHGCLRDNSCADTFCGFLKGECCLTC